MKKKTTPTKPYDISDVVEEHLKDHYVAVFPFNPNDLNFYEWMEQISKRFADLRKTTSHIYSEHDLDPILIDCVKDTVYEILNLISLKYKYGNLVDISNILKTKFGASVSSHYEYYCSYDISDFSDMAFECIMEGGYGGISDDWYNYDCLINAMTHLYIILWKLHEQPTNIDIFK